MAKIIFCNNRQKHLWLAKPGVGVEVQLAVYVRTMSHGNTKLWTAINLLPVKCKIIQLQAVHLTLVGYTSTTFCVAIVFILLNHAIDF